MGLEPTLGPALDCSAPFLGCQFHVCEINSQRKHPRTGISREDSPAASPPALLHINQLFTVQTRCGRLQPTPKLTGDAQVAAPACRPGERADKAHREASPLGSSAGSPGHGGSRLGAESHALVLGGRQHPVPITPSSANLGAVVSGHRCLASPGVPAVLSDPNTPFFKV